MRPSAPRISVEPFDVGYGASFAAADSPLARECPVVEDGGMLTAHDPPRRGRPGGRLAFVDGVMRTDARLVRSELDGTITTGLAGSWAAGAALIDAGRVRVAHVTCGRAVVFCGGAATALPDQPGGWRWTAAAVEGDDVDDARLRLQRLMRGAEGTLADRLCDDGWLTVLDGPLQNVRRRVAPIVGYVKTHHRPMLDAASWARVPRLAVGQRTSLFAIDDDRYGTYVRVGDPGPWASPWAGIARLEVPAGAGRAAAAAAVEGAAAWLPRYASAAHRDPRAPVNLAPVAGLERQLRRHLGDARLAVRAVRAAALAAGRSPSADRPTAHIEEAT